MVRDLDLPLKLIGAPTKREKDGLALSSRNAYLSAEERKIAPTLNAAIVELAAKVAAGKPIPRPLKQPASGCSAPASPASTTSRSRDANTLAEVPKRSDQPLRVLAAVWLGKTRLIDNVPV